MESRAKQIGKSRLDQLLAYHAKYFSNLPVTDESLAQALYIETQQQENLAIAVNNGICQALSE
ncbi:DUF6890 family protein [Pseudoalteromonas issachenkonii]|uniref:DUF6890 family protein n=1 Tax=Pseudoalteromonas issachenkonii TaxID=152297 RepID=UPI003CC9BF8F